ncbi:OLC1v1013249C1 [Oldenlandia corymbosa var. corymbosa]|uniref:OLC1v1013249C1 n=1 Tax=Oldenlandia corymbosa var. corymbosa TaxID=529605 RepID=A0AAV1DYJ5_OLDCO|nr:OLC1v1013249C1 [Oldenlandia corymbosa var. corymbosa]
MLSFCLEFGLGRFAFYVGTICPVSWSFLKRWEPKDEFSNFVLPLHLCVVCSEMALLNKKASEGIALLSIYGDEDDEVDDEEQTAHPHLAELNDQVDTDGNNNHAVNKSPSAEEEDAFMATAEESNYVDLLNKFLPPPPKAKCSDELQEKIIEFLALKKHKGRSYNAEVCNRNVYRNPDSLRHVVTYQLIDEMGSCFSKDVFDPHGYEKCDFYDEIEADMKHEMVRKELEKKRSPKVDFFSRAMQIRTVAMPKINLPITVQIMPGGGFNSSYAAMDPVPGDGRRNKKSKWDKVDGDRTVLELNFIGTTIELRLNEATSILLATEEVEKSSSFLLQGNKGDGEDEDDKRSGDKMPDRRS